MTTNVFDGPVGLVATDSRWSIQRGRWLIYLDDTNFDKIELTDAAAFMFAGSAVLIEKWKLWIRSNPPDASGMPELQGISINGFDIKTKQVGYSEGISIKHEGSVFAGSGARHAVQCWTTNRDARRAVETAKAFDVATGGEVKFVDFTTGEKKLGGTVFAPASVAEIDQALAKRGLIMDITAKGNPIPFKISDLAAAQGEVKEIQEQIAAGKLSAQAPCDAMYSDWTAEETSRLKTFLGNVFGWKN